MAGKYDSRVRRSLREARRVLSSSPSGLMSREARAARLAERERMRLEVLARYGRCSTCCGESHPRALTIDHVRPLRGGRRRPNLYAWLLRHGGPPGPYQVLCLNCNMLKGTGAECPHKRGRAPPSFVRGGAEGSARHKGRELLKPASIVFEKKKRPP